MKDYSFKVPIRKARPEHRRRQRRRKERKPNLPYGSRPCVPTWQLQFFAFGPHHHHLRIFTMHLTWILSLCISGLTWPRILAAPVNISLEFNFLEDEHALLKRDTAGPQLGGVNFPGATTITTTSHPSHAERAN